MTTVSSMSSDINKYYVRYLHFVQNTSVLLFNPV